LAYPVLDQDAFRRLIMGALMFLPVLLATVRLAEIRGWVWPSVFLMLCVLISTVANLFIFHRTLAGIQWGLLTMFFAFTVVGLFSHLKNARSVTNSHLYVAVSIYLLLAMQWFSLYKTIEIFYPGSISHQSGTMNRDSELLYFSLVTLTTVGYGDVVPLDGEVRMLAALEGMAGVLYVAITVALLVNAYKHRSSAQ
jgi:voltage-gated potassium channel Kch